MDWMTFLFSARGRVSRKDFWLRFVLPTFALGLLAAALDGDRAATFANPLGGPVSATLQLALLWPSIALAAKRFHDRGMSGWWPLYVLLIELFGFALAALGALRAGEDFDPATPPPPLAGVYMLPGLFVVVAAAVWQFIVTYCLPGQRGTNQYGPDPLAARS